MAHKNYNQMSNKSNKQNKVETKEVIETVETVEVVEPIEVPEVVIEETEPEAVEYVVTNCEKLNVRKNPSLSAKVECVVAAQSVVVVFPDGSNDEWAEVATESGNYGYCMKKYLTLKK